MALPDRFRVEPIYEGRTAIIIAGGPSLSLAQIRMVARARLRRPGDQFRVMAINDAIYPAYFADWLHAGDAEWWNEHIYTVHEFTGIKTTLDPRVPQPWVSGYLENTGDLGFDENPACCRTGGTSAYQGLHCLIHAGVKRVILLGVDMKDTPDGQKHWFGDHPFAWGKRRVDYAKQMVARFPSILPAIEARGISVVNASPGSALDCFPMMDLADALALC